MYRRNRIGQLLPIWDAIVVALVGSAVVMVVLLAYLSPFQARNVYDVVLEQQAPFYLAQDIERLKIDDRQFLEHAIQSNAQNAATNDNIAKGLATFAKPYDFSYYRIYQDKSKKVFYDVTNIKQNCGNNLEGICTNKWGWTTECGEGREQIEGQCNEGQLCCAKMKQTTAIKCGQFDTGFCTSKIKETVLTDYSVYDTLVAECGEGREIEEDKRCLINTVCCVDKKIDATIKGKNVQIPILYKSELGYVTVSASRVQSPKIESNSPTLLGQRISTDFLPEDIKTGIYDEAKTSFFSSRFTDRRQQVTAVVLHCSSNADLVRTLSRITGASSESMHYVIDKNGDVYNLVAEEDIAFHAGLSSLYGETNVNEFSIGIEFVNDCTEQYTNEQYDSIIKLIDYLAQKYAIAKERIVGEADITLERKKEPCNIDWTRFDNGHDAGKC